jgi:hypothetical protein
VNVKKLIEPLCYAILFLGLGCKYYIDDSFDTFVGTLVNESGLPIGDVELIFTQELNFTGYQTGFASSYIYKLTTDQTGKFKFVVPSKYWDNLYYLEVRPPFQFEIDFFGEKEFQNYIQFDSSEKDKNGIVNLGNVKVVKK